MNYEAGSIEGPEQRALPDHATRPNRRRWWIIAIIVLLACVAAWYAFGRSGKNPAEGAQQGEQLPTVSVIVPGRQTVDRIIAANGTIAARRDLPVGVAGEGGLVTRVLVDSGQWVKAGQVLASVDRSVQKETAASLAAQVSVARADENIAQSELDRAKQLIDRGFVSTADLQRKAATRDAAAARVKVAQASLAEARARTGRLDIRAPTAGLILARSVEPGQVVSPGSGALFRMAMDGRMEMQAALAESDLANVRVGYRANVTPVGSDQSFKGAIWQVSPVIDPQTRQGVARIALSYDPALRPGGFASATIASGNSSIPLLPESAVQSDAKGNYVYIVGQDDKAARRDVTVGAVTDAGVSIASGLNGTERVVAAAAAFLTPGQKVKPVTKTGS